MLWKKKVKCVTHEKPCPSIYMETSTPKQKVKQQQLALFVASFELHHSVGLLRYLDALPLIVEPHWGSIQSNCRNGGLDERASTLSSTCESKKGNLYPYWMVRQKRTLGESHLRVNLCSDASLSGESSQWWCWYLKIQIDFLGVSDSMYTRKSVW